jgi:hypothetical protein
LLSHFSVFDSHFPGFQFTSFAETSSQTRTKISFVAILVCGSLALETARPRAVEIDK